MYALITTKKFLLMGVVSVLFLHTAPAQISHDIVFLKDGSTIRGRVDTTVKNPIFIRQYDGTKWAFDTSQVDEIRHKYQRFIFYNSMGILAGPVQNERPLPLSVICGLDIQFAKYFALGVFTGLELLKETTIPAGICGKVYLPLCSGSIYLNGSAGYSFPAETPEYLDYYYELIKIKGGSLAGLGIGYIIPFNCSNDLFFELGYRYSELEYIYNDWWRSDVARNYYFHRFTLRVGLTLH